MEAFFTESETVSRRYPQEKGPTRFTDTSLCVMFGADADKIAEEFKIPKGFKRKEGWVLSNSRRKQIYKKYRLETIKPEKAESKNVVEKSVVL